MWRAALGDGKISFRKIIALEYAFPTKEADLGLASQCFSAVIEEFKDKGLIFEEGYQQNRTMDGIVFAEGSTYRGKLKIQAAEFVQQYYADDLKTTHFYKNQQGNHADIATKVERLVGIQSMFHKDGVDKQGKANNFMHPCIRDLCIDFYYSKKQDGLAHHFPNEFKDFIPERAVALFIAVIQCALDEYKSGVRTMVDFCGDTYLKFYRMTIQMFAVINSKPNHHAKWKDCRMQWARVAWAKHNPTEDAGDAILTVDVD
ncbi:hypothetical protein CPB83DRAFT_900357 [Crepidotus variabilis]|uniref:DUF6532 domain-containing protein n=1 Tax=Crepidotus variabilis TaxID=179855 RepID=A0A9P6JI22_9AGAR|nr:hypothetical protein CPB83DRAFT_900357 [Crepidotus variabilis]